MKIHLGIAASLLAIALVGVTVTHSQNGMPSLLHVASISLTIADVPQGGSTVSVFIPTGSKSKKCLLTVNETSTPTDLTQAFCAARHSDTDGDGVLVTLYYSYPIGNDFAATLTLWQEGARAYGAPIQPVTAELR